VRSYYQRKDFCVITPYDAQRAALEKQLKAEGLPWERVFNVDSFQGQYKPLVIYSMVDSNTTHHELGNEADYVIISVARTTGPGFLSSQNRVNVMLTRCRAAMIVVTNRVFLRTTGAQYTLLGGLARYWAKHHGESKTWTDWKDVVEQRANMPGVLSAHRIVAPPSAQAVIPPPIPNLPNAIRSPASQPPWTGQPTRTGTPLSQSSHANDDFPALGHNGDDKHVARGGWNSPTGVSAIKRFTKSAGSSSLSSGHPNRRLQSSSAASKGSEQQSHDHFPSLGDHQSGKRLQGRWRDGSSVAKSFRAAN
jgi:hypothetical protein